MRDLLTTDDAAWGLQFTWKGEPDAPMPFEARYSSIVAGMLLLPPYGVAAWIITAPLHMVIANPIVSTAAQFVIALVAALALPVLTVRKYAKHVTADEPAKHHWRVFVAEMAAPRAPAAHTITIPVAVATRPATRRLVGAHIQRTDRETA